MKHLLMEAEAGNVKNKLHTFEPQSNAARESDAFSDDDCLSIMCSSSTYSIDLDMDNMVTAPTTPKETTSSSPDIQLEINAESQLDEPAPPYHVFHVGLELTKKLNNYKIPKKVDLKSTIIITSDNENKKDFRCQPLRKIRSSTPISEDSNITPGIGQIFRKRSIINNTSKTKLVGRKKIRIDEQIPSNHERNANELISSNQEAVSNQPIPQSKAFYGEKYTKMMNSEFEELYSSSPSFDRLVHEVNRRRPSIRSNNNADLRMSTEQSSCAPTFAPAIHSNKFANRQFRVGRNWGNRTILPNDLSNTHEQLECKEQNIHQMVTNSTNLICEKAEELANSPMDNLPFLINQIFGGEMQLSFRNRSIKIKQIINVMNVSLKIDLCHAIALVLRTLIDLFKSYKMIHEILTVTVKHNNVENILEAVRPLFDFPDFRWPRWLQLRIVNQLTHNRITLAHRDYVLLFQALPASLFMQLQTSQHDSIVSLGDATCIRPLMQSPVEMPCRPCHTSIQNDYFPPIPTTPINNNSKSSNSDKYITNNNNTIITTTTNNNNNNNNKNRDLINNNTTNEKNNNSSNENNNSSNGIGSNSSNENNNSSNENKNKIIGNNNTIIVLSDTTDQNNKSTTNEKNNTTIDSLESIAELVLSSKVHSAILILENFDAEKLYKVAHDLFTQRSADYAEIVRALMSYYKGRRFTRILNNKLQTFMTNVSFNLLVKIMRNESMEKALSLFHEIEESGLAYLQAQLYPENVKDEFSPSPFKNALIVIDIFLNAANFERAVEIFIDNGFVGDTNEWKLKGTSESDTELRDGYIHDIFNLLFQDDRPQTTLLAYKLFTELQKRKSPFTSNTGRLIRLLKKLLSGTAFNKLAYDTFVKFYATADEVSKYSLAISEPSICRAMLVISDSLDTNARDSLLQEFIDMNVYPKWLLENHSIEVHSNWVRLEMEILLNEFMERLANSLKYPLFSCRIRRELVVTIKECAMEESIVALKANSSYDAAFVLLQDVLFHMCPSVRTVGRKGTLVAIHEDWKKHMDARLALLEGQNHEDKSEK
ncbi:uncharacterized protein LOC111043991 isoform X2 [Nilaparvata lugens]|uniref:uncharacterized protein LOC111043991 isoform X2 n=1 Tax=Nilaparvata lugens TaxID=108931 RepID=UPI00193D19CF|nr:uncharacterized protein LOC111043991 isoform X2 [Nilaparvata lugens]